MSPRLLPADAINLALNDLAFQRSERQTEEQGDPPVQNPERLGKCALDLFRRSLDGRRVWNSPTCYQRVPWPCPIAHGESTPTRPCCGAPKLLPVRRRPCRINSALEVFTIDTSTVCHDHTSPAAAGIERRGGPPYPAGRSARTPRSSEAPHSDLARQGLATQINLRSQSKKSKRDFRRRPSCSW